MKKKPVLSFSAFYILLPISDFSGQSDVTEYILTIFKNLFKYHGVHKNSNEKKIGERGEGEEGGEEERFYPMVMAEMFCISY